MYINIVVSSVPLFATVCVYKPGGQTTITKTKTTDL